MGNSIAMPCNAHKLEAYHGISWASLWFHVPSFVFLQAELHSWDKGRKINHLPGSAGVLDIGTRVSAKFSQQNSVANPTQKKC